MMTNSYENKKEPSSTDYNFKEKMIVILMGDQKFRNEGKYYVVPIFQFLDHKDGFFFFFCYLKFFISLCCSSHYSLSFLLKSSSPYFFSRHLFVSQLIFLLFKLNRDKSKVVSF